MARKRRGVDADAPGVDAEGDQMLDHELPYPDPPRFRLHIDLVDHAEARAVAQCLPTPDPVADHHVFGGADDHERVVSVAQLGERVVERFGPRLTCLPQRAAPLAA